MFGSVSSGANAYAKVGIETGVMAASPHTLIVMLFDCKRCMACWATSRAPGSRSSRPLKSR